MLDNAAADQGLLLGGFTNAPSVCNERHGIEAVFDNSWS